MYLKRIELEGFKSFADRTVIPVERGLTGIVGPNGCGKSNVVDALLWVMGERSSKALRADHMDDVIFKGAEGRKAAPYAMVEVILGDPEGKIVEVGGEIAVGRRLFANGDAEYLLHGRKVRRKDVREVLMDTGLGVQGYMVLAQGKIDAAFIDLAFLAAEGSARLRVHIRSMETARVILVAKVILPAVVSG
ncbi:MAG: AAA family ATPase, partial [Planctomycetes bacterium]|nr:AAA family ATPase [Planctomycetota bacterium]